MVYHPNSFSDNLGKTILLSLITARDNSLPIHFLRECSASLSNGGLDSTENGIANSSPLHEAVNVESSTFASSESRRPSLYDGGSA